FWGGGPKPTNTLARGTAAQRLFNSSSRAASYGRKLETTSVVGDNVQSAAAAAAELDAPTFESKAKRRKIEHPYNSQRTPHIVDEDEEDILNTEYASVQHKSRSENRRAVSRVSDIPGIDLTVSANRDIYPSMETFEFSAVEKTMNSRGYRSDPKQQRYSLDSSKTNSPDLLDKEIVQKPLKAPYSGTARPSLSADSSRGQEAKQEKHISFSDRRSPHFPPRYNSGARPESSKSNGISVPREKIKHGDQRQRGGESSSQRTKASLECYSPDELTTAKATMKTLSPTKYTRLMNTSKQRLYPKETLPLFEDDKSDSGLAKSNIPPSKFVEGRGSMRSIERSGYKNSYPEEKEAPWSIPLASFYFRGEEQSPTNLALVFNDSGENLNVYDAGQDLSAKDPSLQIQLRKVLKVMWAQGGVKVRFESSKCGNYENRLDIVMKSEKDVSSLLEKAQERHNFKVIGKSISDMDKMFSYRNSEQMKATKPASSSIVPDSEALQPDLRRTGQTDTKRMCETLYLNKSKRPRLDEALRSQDKAGSEPRVQSPPSSPRMLPVIESTISTTEDKAPSEMDQLLKSLESGGRSLRSSYRPNVAMKNPTSTLELSPTLNKFPQEQRYSRLHGLGEKWKRALTYPKDGKKRTTVDWIDLERLDEGEFLNDNLIAFYLRVLESRMEQNSPDIARRVYMFNTFFYERLTSGHKGPKGINYAAVQKWTRGVDIFTYDYLVVPVNESAHWYAAIVCNLPALRRSSVMLGSDPEAPSIFDAAKSEENARSPDKGSEAGRSKSNPKDPLPSSPTEREAAASFGAMTLEGHIDEAYSFGQRSKSSSVDQEMLDPQTPELRSKTKAENSLEFGEAARSADGRVGIEGSNAGKLEVQATQSTKKGKRKSIPPVRTLSPDQPSIITFDSFGTAHASTIRILKSYLREEAREKRGDMDFDDSELKGMTAKPIPQQDNFCDCGLFLLGYVEKFLDGPRDFITKVVKREFDVKKDWPKNLDPSSMRSEIRSMLQKLYKEQYDDRQARKQAAIRAGASSGKCQKPSLSSSGPAIDNQRFKSIDKRTTRDTHLIGEAAPASDGGSRTVDSECAAKVEKSLGSLTERQEDSLVVLDKQSQPDSFKIIPQRSSDEPEPLQLTPELPSTIEDSQPPRDPSPHTPTRTSPTLPEQPLDEPKKTPFPPKSPHPLSKDYQKPKSPATRRKPKVMIEID
ncbi:MAG: hypothetical protein Q9190_007485, partial [Brigantiaea leucoxantha]